MSKKLSKIGKIQSILGKKSRKYFIFYEKFRVKVGYAKFVRGDNGENFVTITRVYLKIEISLFSQV
jgi:hypothetical protein